MVVRRVEFRTAEARQEITDMIRYVLNLRIIVGGYMCFYTAVFFLQKILPESGVMFIVSLSITTLIFAWIASFLTLSRWKWKTRFVLKSVIATLFAAAATPLICVATLFNPLGVRPSPIPLSDNVLDVLMIVMHVLIGIFGSWLIFSAVQRFPLDSTGQ